jgi:hypothetical protein
MSMAILSFLRMGSHSLRRSVSRSPVRISVILNGRKEGKWRRRMWWWWWWWKGECMSVVGVHRTSVHKLGDDPELVAFAFLLLRPNAIEADDVRMPYFPTMHKNIPSNHAHKRLVIASSGVIDPLLS